MSKKNSQQSAVMTRKSDYGDEFMFRLFDQLDKRGIVSDFHKRHARPVRGRSYDMGVSNDLLGDWNVSQSSADANIKASLVKSRARSRDMERNNDYVKKYLSMSVNNIIGAHGIMLQNRALTNSKKPDKHANDLIEGSWREWGKKINCTVDGRMSFHGVEKMTARSVPRDGEILVRKVFGFDNPWRFALQIFESDRLDIDFDNIKMANGNRVRMGVEMDSWGRPVAYHLLEDHPGDYSFISTTGRRTARIPATEMKLIYLPTRAEQTRGFPWIHSAAVKLHQLGRYQEAEVVAARGGASKSVYYERDIGAQTDNTWDGVDEQGNPIQEMSPGVAEILPPGWKANLMDPTHPAGNYPAFVEAALQGLASGLDVSYVSLANNLKGVNFSSIRQGVLDERTSWRMQQGFIIEELHNWIFPDWLRMTLITDLAGKLSMSRFDNYNKPSWNPRGWDWVDPKKDAEGRILEINNKLTSRTIVVSQKGLNFADVLEDLKREEEMIKAAGLDREEVTKATANAAPTPADDNPDNVDLKASMDTYGIGVRSGSITPQQADEEHFRKLAELPEISEDVSGAWTADGGTRRPVTLASGTAFEATQEDVAGDAGADDATGNEDQEDEE